MGIAINISNDLLRRQRELRGWSQNKVADLLHEQGGAADSKLVGKWERGVVKPSPYYREKLCLIFNCAADELGFIERSLTTQQPIEQLKLYSLASPEQEHVPGVDFMGNQFDPTRRTLITQMLGLALLPASDLLNPEKKKLSPITNSESLNQYEQLMLTCWDLSNKKSLDAVQQLLHIFLPSISALAQSSSPHQKRAANLASQGYQLAYVVSSHHEDFNTSLLYCKKAKLYGEIAGDPNLQVSALIRQGVTFLHRRSPYQSLESYQEALYQVNDSSPLTCARLYAAIAEVQGKIGLEQDFRRSIGLANESFSASSQHDPAALYMHFQESSLYLHEGLALLDLHKPGEAMSIFNKVDGLNPRMPLSERNRVDFLNQQAMAAGQLRDLDQFKIYMEAAVSSAKALGSELRLSESWDTYKRIQSTWGNEPSINALSQIFQR